MSQTLCALPQRRTVPIDRWRQFDGQRAAVTVLNPESNIDCFTLPLDENGKWFEELRAGDVVTVDVERQTDRCKNTFIGKVAPLNEQPNKLQTAVRMRQRGQEDLRRSEIMLPPDYAEALKYARIAANDPDTKTYASRIVMAHLGPVLACMKAAEGKKNA